MSLAQPFHVPCHLTWEWPKDYTVYFLQVYANNELFLHYAVTPGDDPKATVLLKSGIDYHIEVVVIDFTGFRGKFIHYSPSAGVDAKSP